MKKNTIAPILSAAVLFIMLQGLADTHAAGPPRTIASSADGARFAAAVNSGQSYTSTDSGITWSARLDLGPTVNSIIIIAPK